MTKLPTPVAREKTTDEYIVAAVSATRAWVIFLRWAYPDIHESTIIKRWNITSLIGSACIFAICELIDPMIGSSTVFYVGWAHAKSSFLFIFVFGFLLSRCIEINFAFYRDALDKVAKRPKNTSLSKLDRIQLLFVSYLELIFNFGLLFFLLQRLNIASFSDRFDDAIHAVYFSGITITTVGYGDLYPKDIVTRSICVLEAMSGLLLFAVALAVYLGEDEQEVETEPYQRMQNRDCCKNLSRCACLVFAAHPELTARRRRVRRTWSPRRVRRGKSARGGSHPSPDAP